jgi:acetyl-CoA acetyltransferase
MTRRGGKVESEFPRARIPFGCWGSSYFPSWQTSPLAEVNIGQFAGEAMGRILGLRGVQTSQIDYLVSGSTIPWHWKFWNSPMLSHCFGRRIPGYHLEQACATGLQAMVAAASEIQVSHREAVGVLTFDRCSDSPVGVFPERRTYQRTVPLADVWDNFGFDPATGKAMIATAGNVARKFKLERQEIDEMTAGCYDNYYAAKQAGHFDDVLVPLEILSAQGKPAGVLDDDRGVRRVTLAELRGMRELDTCVTSGTQTHPADGMACVVVASADQAKELSRKPEISIELIAKTEVRTEPATMPLGPSEATRKLLARTGLVMDDFCVVKSHNPFAVNDVLFSKVHDYSWRKMNRTGSSLVWGHPQGPTLTRIALEAITEATRLGGGLALVMGCAAGDVGIAGIFRVTDTGERP